MTMADAAVFGALHGRNHLHINVLVLIREDREISFNSAIFPSGNLAFHVILVKGLCKEFADFWRWMNACRAANAAFDKLATDVQAKAEKTVKVHARWIHNKALKAGKTSAVRCLLLPTCSVFHFSIVLALPYVFALRLAARRTRRVRQTAASLWSSRALRWARS